MARFRRDTHETNEHGQTLHFARWIGGPSLSAIGGCACDDGKPRTVEITGEADTYFSVPAVAREGGKHVAGYVTCDDGCYAFHATGKNRHLIRHADRESIPSGGYAAIGDLIAYDNEGDATAGLARCVGLTERDGIGQPYVDADGLPIRRLVCLCLSSNGSAAYVRHIDPAKVTEARKVESGAFVAWLFAGPIGTLPEMLRSADYGSLCDRYFDESCDDHGRIQPRAK